MAKKNPQTAVESKTATTPKKTSGNMTIEGLGSPFTVKQMLKHSKQEISRINQIKGQRFLNGLVEKCVLAKSKVGLESVYSAVGPVNVHFDENGEVQPTEDTAVNGSVSAESEEGEDPEPTQAVQQTLEQKLSMCTGTECYYEHKVFGVSFKFTDGIKLLADEGKAYWLIDAILSYQTAEFRTKNPFQVWKLIPNKLSAKNPDGCTLKCEDGNGSHVKLQRIPFTDFPFNQFTEPPKFFFQNDVLFVPSEY